MIKKILVLTAVLLVTAAQAETPQEIVQRVMTQKKPITSIKDVRVCEYNKTKIYLAENLEQQVTGFRFLSEKKLKNQAILFPINQNPQQQYTVFDMQGVDFDIAAFQYNVTGQQFNAWVMAKDSKQPVVFDNATKFVLEFPSTICKDDMKCYEASIPKQLSDLKCNSDKK